MKLQAELKGEKYEIEIKRDGEKVSRELTDANTISKRRKSSRMSIFSNITIEFFRFTSRRTALSISVIISLKFRLPIRNVCAVQMRRVQMPKELLK